MESEWNNTVDDYFRRKLGDKEFARLEAFADNASDRQLDQAIDSMLTHSACQDLKADEASFKAAHSPRG